MGLDVGEIGMGLDLGLDLRLFAARSAGRIAAAAKGGPAAVDACIRSLEEERRKIEVFRRELPLCVRLLADVIEELKETAARGAGDAAAKADDRDKRKWMSTAQLWVDGGAKPEESEKKERPSEIISPEPKLLGGSPLAAAAVPPLLPPCFGREDRAAITVGLSDLSLLPPAAKRPISPITATDEHRQSGAARFTAVVPVPPSGPVPSSIAQTQQQQAARKARRCWSPELHRQFVAALHQLGGPQVATPKQIRELMQVDGLTNDEVKSHLQKYRLHNRRSPGAGPVTRPIVLMGGLWVPQNQSSSQSGSPDGPLRLSSSRSGVAISAATAGGDSSSSSGRSSDEDDKSVGYSCK